MQMELLGSWGSGEALVLSLRVEANFRCSNLVGLGELLRRKESWQMSPSESSTSRRMKELILREMGLLVSNIRVMIRKSLK